MILLAWLTTLRALSQTQFRTDSFVSGVAVQLLGEKLVSCEKQKKNAALSTTGLC